MHESLDEKGAEVVNLNERISKLTNSINSLTIECSAVATAKVAELSKKNRRLTSELQSVKSKCKQIENSHHDLEVLLKEKLEQLKPVEENPPAPSDLQVLNDKLEKSNKKVFEILNQNTQLKNELKMAQKCLQQEIGENITVAQLLSGSSNWRGRAQQITMLNSKINELKEKIDATSYDSYDEGSRLTLKRLESIRRMEVESLNKELDECKSQLDDLKQKVVAFKTRNKNLSDDVSNYKFKTLDLLEKSQRDDEYIKSLNEQILMCKYEFNHKLDDMKKEIERSEMIQQDGEIEVQKLQCQLHNQAESMNEKDNEIVNLKLAIDQLETNLRDMSNDFLFSCRQMSKEQYMTLLKSLEEEKGNLMSLFEQLTERLNKESTKTCEQNDTINKQRQKIARLEADLREVEAEKEASKAKHRRSLRISEYSRTASNSSVVSARPSTRSNDRLIAEIDKYKFK